MRKLDCHRFKPEYDREPVLVERTEVDQIVATPKWNKLVNSHFALSRVLINTFTRVSNVVLVRNRAEKRLNQIKAFIEKNKIKNRHDMIIYVEMENKLAHKN